MKSLRIAFLTPEFVTERDSAGGAANYVRKIMMALRDLGHEPEVFVFSGNEPRVLEYEGIRVNRTGTAVPVGLRLRHLLQGPLDWSRWLGLLGKPRPAIPLAETLQQRERDKPFDAVVSLTLDLSGLYVSSRMGRPHLVRITSSETQFRQYRGGRLSLLDRVVMHLTRRTIRRADVAFAPSQFSANEYARRLGRPVLVCRTPAFIEVEPAEGDRSELPSRYLLHFGRIGSGKGSEDIAAALPIAWAREPDLRMVWAGKEIVPGDYQRCASHWASDEHRVIWLGAVDKPALYGLLEQAVACALPSRVDNLPNTAIESLLFQKPVIGTRGTSIDELVEDGRSGELIEPGDVQALADTMVRMWRGESVCQRQGFQPPAVLEQMQPRRAAQALLELIDTVSIASG